jgi:hypothetical protein
MALNLAQGFFFPPQGQILYLAFMSSRPGLAAVIAFMMLGCVTPEATPETSQERAQREPPVRHYDARGVQDTHSHRLGFGW